MLHVEYLFIYEKLRHNEYNSNYPLLGIQKQTVLLFLIYHILVIIIKALIN